MEQKLKVNGILLGLIITNILFLVIFIIGFSVAVGMAVLFLGLAVAISIWFIYNYKKSYIILKENEIIICGSLQEGTFMFKRKNKPITFFLKDLSCYGLVGNNFDIKKDPLTKPKFILGRYKNYIGKEVAFKIKDETYIHFLLSDYTIWQQRKLFEFIAQKTGIEPMEQLKKFNYKKGWFRWLSQQQTPLRERK